jgi:hypothetical protein
VFEIQTPSAATQLEPGSQPAPRVPALIRWRSRVVEIDGQRRRLVNVGALSTIWQVEAAFGGVRYGDLSPRAQIAFRIVADHLDQERRERAEQCRVARERRESRWALISAGRLSLKDRDVSLLHDSHAPRERAAFSAFVDEYVDAELEAAA